jgi:hypothetical protein
MPANFGSGPLSMLPLLLVVMAMAGQALGQGQSARIDGGVVSRERFGFYWETHLQPPTPPMSTAVTTDSYFTAAGGGAGDGIIHRILLDSSRRIYVGYDAVVERLEEPNTYQVTFRRLTMSPEWAKRFLGDNPSLWTMVATPGWGLPAPRKIYGGEVLALPLLTNPATRQTVTDYVTVQEPARNVRGFQQVPERRFTFAPGPARDFKIEDAQLFLQAPRLSINGKLDPTSTDRFGDVSGAVVWFYTAGRGRFLLSLAPRPEMGFRKAGEVRGSSLSFVVGSDTFVLNGGDRMAPGQGPFSLYVLHEPGWKPAWRNADMSAFTMGATDRAESLITTP